MIDIDKDELDKQRQADQQAPIVIVVEDDAVQRNELTRLLEARGFAVVAMDTGSGAIVGARGRHVSVILMDIAFDNDEIDGIEAAQAIQSEQPLTSFIFVTAFADNPEYRERVEASGVRLGGWVSKPYKIVPLVELIAKEGQKLELLADATKAAERGIDLPAYLHDRADSDSSLTRDIIEEILEESQADAPERSSSSKSGDRQETPMAIVNAEIDSLYDQIRDLVATQADAASRREAVQPLRAKLESLEAREADLIRDHFRAQLRFDADRAEQAERRMRELLEEA